MARHYKIALLALCIATPLAAQHRAGFGIMNLGPLTHEDSAYVRSGNSGWDGYIYLQVDVGKRGGWYAGFGLAPSRIFVWAIEPCGARISRWSWRPGCPDPNTGAKQPHKEHIVTWLMPEVGYVVKDVATFDVRLALVALFPFQTGYAWGAPVGAQPGVGVAFVKNFVGMDYSVWIWAVYKRPHGLTVLQDWSTPERGVDDPMAHLIIPIGISIGGVF